LRTRPLARGSSSGCCLGRRAILDEASQGAELHRRDLEGLIDRIAFVLGCAGDGRQDDVDLGDDDFDW
jgi:hypothetical protein